MMGLKSLTDADVECINLNFFTGTPPIYGDVNEYMCLFVYVNSSEKNPIMHTNKTQRKSTIKLDRIMDGNLCRTIRLVLAHSQVNSE